MKDLFFAFVRVVDVALDAGADVSAAVMAAVGTPVYADVAAYYDAGTLPAYAG